MTFKPIKVHTFCMYMSTIFGKSDLGFKPPNNVPTSDRPYRNKPGCAENGVFSPATPQIIVSPQP